VSVFVKFCKKKKREKKIKIAGISIGFKILTGNSKYNFEFESLAARV